MNNNLKIALIVITCLFVAGASLAYGAMTAPKQQPQSQTIQSVKLSKAQLEKELEAELPAITRVLIAKYPLITTTYTIDKGQLYDQGQWFGTTLSYIGTDKNNRDTLRVLLQKDSGTWILRTNPPRLLLSAKDFPDVPKSILKSINQPVSLPGADNSPTIGS